VLSSRTGRRYLSCSARCLSRDCRPPWLLLVGRGVPSGPCRLGGDAGLAAGAVLWPDAPRSAGLVSGLVDGTRDRWRIVSEGMGSAGWHSLPSGDSAGSLPFAACEISPRSHPKREAARSSLVAGTKRYPRPGTVAPKLGATQRTTDGSSMIVADPAWWFVSRGRRHRLVTVVMNLENSGS
jgi:hypothetical protein